MLKPLTKNHRAVFAAVQDNIFVDRNSVSNFDFRACDRIIKHSRKYKLSLHIYIDDFQTYADYVQSKYDCKALFSKNGCYAVKINKKPFPIYLVNANLFFPIPPPNIYKALQFLYEKLGKGLLPALTSANYALSLFRLKYQKENLRGLSYQADNHIREAYAGGRAEIFERKLKNGYEYDLNSSYAYAMLNEMPVGSAVWTNERHKKMIGFYRAKINQKNINKPPLWTKINGALCFPADEFEGVWDSAEIDIAQEAGAKVEIKYGYEFDKKAIFKEFALDIYKLKENGDEWLSKFAKRMLVSLYGKFGFKREQSRTIKFETIYKYQEAKDKDASLYLIDPINLFAQKSQYIKQPKYALPQLAAHISSLGRVELYKTIINQDAVVAYIHTDSLFTDALIETGTGIGEWKLKGKVKNAEFKGINTYEMDVGEDEHQFITGGFNFEDKNQAALYLRGEQVEIYKKNKLSQSLVKYNVQLTNNLYKRKFDGNSSRGATIEEIKAQILK